MMPDWKGEGNPALPVGTGPSVMGNGWYVHAIQGRGYE